MRRERAAYLGLGSNVGDRYAHLRAAIGVISRSPGITIQAVSPIYETEPVGVHEQPWFLNCVARVSTVLPPAALLVAAKKVEMELGRTATFRWGPREIDVDVLLYEGERQESEELTLPHPRMKERLFVLLPLRDLDPGWKDEEGRGIDQLIERLQGGEQVRPYQELAG